MPKKRKGHINGDHIPETGYHFLVLMEVCPVCSAKAGDRCTKQQNSIYDYGKPIKILPDAHPERVARARRKRLVR